MYAWVDSRQYVIYNHGFYEYYGHRCYRDNYLYGTIVIMVIMVTIVTIITVQYHVRCTLYGHYGYYCSHGNQTVPSAVQCTVQLTVTPPDLLSIWFFPPQRFIFNKISFLHSLKKKSYNIFF